MMVKTLVMGAVTMLIVACGSHSDESTGKSGSAMSYLVCTRAKVTGSFDTLGPWGSPALEAAVHQQVSNLCYDATGHDCCGFSAYRWSAPLLLEVQQDGYLLEDFR